MPELSRLLDSESEAVQKRGIGPRAYSPATGPVLCWCLTNNGDPAMSIPAWNFGLIRESRGLTVDRIASATRIPVHYIEALERDDVRALPARPYLRGFVAAYGRELGLDPADAVSRYFAHLGPPPPEPVMAADVAPDEPGYSRAWGIAVLVLAVLLAIPAFNKWRSAVEPPQPAVAGTTGTVPAATAAAGARPRPYP